MAYYLKVEGMAEISEMLSKLEEAAPAIAAEALYEGAAVMKDAIFKEMASIQTAPFKYAKDGQIRLPSPEEKEVLMQAGVGVAKFDKNGVEIDTSVGFNQSGYANVSWRHMNSQARTNYKAVYIKGRESNSSSLLKAIGMGKGEQNQKPIGAVANAINSGTSFMKKQPFVRKAARSGGAKAMSKMQSYIEDAFGKITK